ncbi:rhotekin isoform X2 [Bufo bufo]|uniref:rhotekin isoform X2 n=1 Tax=Bufo bufo TaxID=8384 RepID=UPI001ABE82D2|nr:rhotekin isoform X2 [Bufo bufo]
MFCRNHRSRVTVARCSALEMEIRRGRFRRSMLVDTPQDTDIQKRIDHEVRMREGAVKLLGACTQKEQALEAAKSLLVCNSRIMTYMSELQHRKEEQVLQHSARRPSDGGSVDERLPCKGKLSISDLRIPLMWKDSEYFKNKGELHRCAVFCALQIRGEVYDTEMVFVDRTTTDICFENAIVFSDVDPGFELSLQLYSCAVDEDFSLSGTPRRLSTRLSTSLGRSSGRRLRATMDGTGSNGGGGPILLPPPSVPGPKFQLLAHTKLTLAHVQDGFRTHDLTISSSDESSCWLPLYGSVCCRLTAQPDCMNQDMMSGVLHIQGRGQKSWQRLFCVLRGCQLLCYKGQSHPGSETEPDLTVSVNKDTRIRCSDRDGQSLVHTLSITNRYGSEEVTHTAKAESREDLRRWMEAFWQHFYDMSQWKQCCDDLMKIETPPPKRQAAALAKQGSLYHEMAIEGLGPIPDLLSQRMKEFELQRGLDPPPWTSFFHNPSPGHPSSSSSECDSPPAQSSKHRPRTLSLDAKLTSLKSRGLKMTESPSSLGSPRTRNESPRPEARNGSGSSTPDLERGCHTRKNTKSLKTKLDPRNWLQSQV